MGAARDIDDGDLDHRARLLERSIHKVMDERERGERGDSFELGYGKWWTRFRGPAAYTFLIGVVIAAGLYMLNQKLEAHNAQMLASEQRLQKSVEESNDLQNAMVYVLWACRTGNHDARECETLNLARPKKLTEMMRER